jgi:hypothetical protein
MPIAPKGLAKNNTSANDDHHHERVVPRAIEVCIWAISHLPHFTLTYFAQFPFGNCEYIATQSQICTPAVPLPKPAVTWPTVIVTLLVDLQANS